MCEICSKLTIKTPDIFIVNFEQNLPIALSDVSIVDFEQVNTGLQYARTLVFPIPFFPVMFSSYIGKYGSERIRIPHMLCSAWCNTESKHLSNIYNQDTKRKSFSM